MLLKVEFVHTE